MEPEAARVGRVAPGVAPVEPAAPAGTLAGPAEAAAPVEPRVVEVQPVVTRVAADEPSRPLGARKQIELGETGITASRSPFDLRGGWKKRGIAAAPK
jgi:hypothetical protein